MMHSKLHKITFHTIISGVKYTEPLALLKMINWSQDYIYLLIGMR